MKEAKIGESKNNLSCYLEYVRAGGWVLVLDRDRPVARLVPLQPTAHGTKAQEARLARLERQGLLRRGEGGVPSWLGKRKPPRLRGSVLRDLLRERGSGW